MARIFIDGEAGTTGLGIRDRLAGQPGIELVSIDPAQRKNASLPSVVVLEALSQILPEQTYVTEFRIEGTKLRLVGVTSDAPALIALLEESHFFSHASFFAPTTRSSSQTAERFHIEATIEPLDSARS